MSGTPFGLPTWGLIATGAAPTFIALVARTLFERDERKKVEDLRGLLLFTAFLLLVLAWAYRSLAG